MSRESLGLPNLSLPRPLKTLNLSVFMTKFNMIFLICIARFSKKEEMIFDIINLLVADSRDISTF